jgi:hypothetical protein
MLSWQQSALGKCGPRNCGLRRDTDEGTDRLRRADNHRLLEDEQASLPEAIPGDVFLNSNDGA